MNSTDNIPLTEPYAANAEYAYDDMAQYKANAPQNFSRGFEPYETLPATWFNTLMRQTTLTLQATKAAVDQLFAEMNSLMVAGDQTPDATKVNQILLAIQKVTELNIATASILGGVKSSSDDWKVSVGVDGKMTVNTTLATAANAGLVKSQTTGTDANKTYNVEVNNDGTMKVCVPWPTYQLKLEGTELSIVSDGSGSATVILPSNAHAVSATYLRPANSTSQRVTADSLGNLTAHTLTLKTGSEFDDGLGD